MSPIAVTLLKPQKLLPPNPYKHIDGEREARLRQRTRRTKVTQKRDVEVF